MIKRVGARGTFDISSFHGFLKVVVDELIIGRLRHESAVRWAVVMSK